MPPLGLGALGGSAKQAYVLADCLVACLHVRTDRKATTRKGGKEKREREEEEEEEEVFTSDMPW